MREDPPCIFMIQGVSLWVTAKKVQNVIGTASGYIWYDDIQIVRVERRAAKARRPAGGDPAGGVLPLVPAEGFEPPAKGL